MASDLGFEALCQALTIRGLTVRNRIVMPAMQRQWCVDGRPMPRLTDYYCERAKGGVGLLITESCAVDHPSATQNPVFARINVDTVDNWSHCVRAVNSAGAPMLMQLWHEGAIRKEGGDGLYSKYPTLSPSGLIHGTKPNGRAASLEDLASIADAFTRSALMAQHAGFAGVELHAAHGFLLDQFLWPETNRRTDSYGGASMVDRVRFPAEVVAAIRKAVRDDFVISFRFSQWKEVNYGAKIAQSPDELRVMLRELRAAGVDVFHASARWFWMPEWPGSDLGLAGWVKSLTDAKVIAVGSVGLDIDLMKNFVETEAKSTGAQGLRDLVKRFEQGQFDLVSVGRSLIGDAQWVEKVREGKFGDIKMFTKKDLLGDLELADFNPDAGH